MRKEATDYSVSDDLSWIKQLIRREKDLCTGCKKCMGNCPMLETFCDGTEAEIAGTNQILSSPKELLGVILEDVDREPIIPFSCALCGYCCEVCPEGVNLKKVFSELRIYHVERNNGIPAEISSRSIRFHQKSSFGKIFASDILRLQNVEAPNCPRIFFPGCSLTAESLELLEGIMRYLEEKDPSIGIYLNCCGKPTESMGDQRTFRSYYEGMEKKLLDAGVEEVLVACANCYQMFRKHSPQLRVRTIYEFIAEQGLPDEACDASGESGDSDTSGKAFGIHDPCPTRGNEEIHRAVRKIASEMGLNIHEPEFTGRRTLCCGSGGMLGVTNPPLAKGQIQKRASQFSDQQVLCYCQECVESFECGGKEARHILELLFPAPGVKLAADRGISEGEGRANVRGETKEKKTTLKKWINRYKAKGILSKGRRPVKEKSMAKSAVADSSKSSAIWKILKYGLILSILVSLIYFLNRNNILKGLTPTEIKEYMGSFGPTAPLVYIVLFTLVPLTLFPDSVLAITGGMCFGLLGGFTYTMIGALCGGTLSFFLARGIGRGIIRDFFMKEQVRNSQGQNLSEKIRDKGFLMVLVLRLIPLFPFDVISYSAGLAGIRFRDFFLATLLGILPGVFVFTNIGHKATKIGSMDFFFSVGLFGLLLASSWALKKRIPSLNELQTSKSERKHEKCE